MLVRWSSEVQVTVRLGSNLKSTRIPFGNKDYWDFGLGLLTGEDSLLPTGSVVNYPMSFFMLFNWNVLGHLPYTQGYPGLVSEPWTSTQIL